MSFYPFKFVLPDDRIGQGVGRPKDKLCRSFGLGALPDLEFEINHLKRSFVCRNNSRVTLICRAFAYFDFPQVQIFRDGPQNWRGECQAERSPDSEFLSLFFKLI